MLNLKQLTEAMSKSISTMEGLQAKVAQAEEAQDTDAATQAKSLYDEESKKFEALKAKAAEAKEHQKRKAMLDEVNGLAQVESAKGKSMPDPSQAINHERDERDVTNLFLDYVMGKKLEGKAREALTPKSERLRNANENSVVVPSRIVTSMFGRNYAKAFGKTMYSTATPAVGTNPSAAQNLVPPDFRPQLQMLPLDVPTVYDRVSVVPSGTGNVIFPCLAQTDANEFGGVSFQWMGEGATKPEKEPEFEQKEIATHELCGYTEVSERLLSRSAIQIEPLLSTLFRAAMVYTIDNAIINGTGVGMPAGIIGTAGIRIVTRTAAGQVQYADLVDLKHAVKPVHRANATFVLSDSVENGLELQFDNFGRPLFRSSVAEGPYDRLVGYPYYVATNCPVLGQQGDIIYGNLGMYVLTQEEEITLARSSEYRFRNNLIAFKIYTVVGGRLMQPRALAILGGES